MWILPGQKISSVLWWFVSRVHTQEANSLSVMPVEKSNLTGVETPRNFNGLPSIAIVNTRSCPWRPDIASLLRTISTTTSSGTKFLHRWTGKSPRCRSTRFSLKFFETSLSCHTVIPSFSQIVNRRWCPWSLLSAQLCSFIWISQQATSGDDERCRRSISSCLQRLETPDQSTPSLPHRRALGRLVR